MIMVTMSIAEAEPGTRPRKALFKTTAPGAARAKI